MKVYTKDGFRITRIRYGLSIKSLAERMDISRQALSQIELGKHGISPENAKKACDILETDFDTLFEIKERA